MRNIFTAALALCMSVQAWSSNLPFSPVVSSSEKPANLLVSGSNTLLKEVSNSSGFPTTGVIDNFNRTNGTIGSNWSIDKDHFRITDNQMVVKSDGMIFWNHTAFGPDQEVYVTFVNVDTSATNMDLLLKSQDSERKINLLEASYNPAKKIITIDSYTSGKGYTGYCEKIPATFANGDQFGARATADGKIYVYKNGTTLAVCDVTSWPNASQGGYVGLIAWNAPNAIFDDFGGGTTAGTGPQVPAATLKPIPTRTRANTRTATVTRTPRARSTAVTQSAPTATKMPTILATNTMIPTTVIQNIPIATGTQTPVPSSTVIKYNTPTLTMIPTLVTTNSLTPTVAKTNAPIVTVPPTSVPTWTATITSIPTSSTFPPTITNTPIATATNIPAATATVMPTVNPAPFSFVSMGDAQAESANFTLTVNQIKTLNPNFVIFNGDLENDGVWSSEMNPMVNDLKNAGLYNQSFLVRGNHDDHISGSSALWESYFETAPNIRVLPTGVTNYVSLNSSSDNLNYSFVYGNAMFIGLDVPGDVDLLTSAQITFLDARLTYAESRGLVHAFIYFHGPLYCVESTHCSCTTKTDASCTPSTLVSVLNKHPIVSATFHGHEHILGWTHMDNTRVAGLTGSFEEFLTSPSGGWTYNSYLYPARMDYTYMDMGSSQAFASISVNGSSFTINFYKVGTTAPVWKMTFTKGAPVATITPAPTLGPSLTQSPSLTRTPTSTRTPTPVITGTSVSTPTTTVIPSITNTPVATITPALTQTPSRSQTPTLTPININGSIPAFYGAEGFGAGSLGGRGGKVYEITNTNDSGSGSLRSCVEASGPRICVFKTGGLISLNSPLSIKNPYITIAGQTAPGGGITIKLGSSTEVFLIKTHDVIMRYITVRPGPGGENHGNQIAANGVEVYNIMIDHNTYSWGVDSDIETWYRVVNTSIQWSIISEPLDCSTHSKGCHSKGLMIGGYAGGEGSNTKGSENISILHNLIAHYGERGPLIQACGIVQIVNNISYDPLWTFAHQQLNCPNYTSYVNWIGNYHKLGPDSTSTTDLKVIPADNGTMYAGKVYVQGNIGPSRKTSSQPDSDWVNSGSRSFIVTLPAIAPIVTTTDALTAYNSVLANAGNNAGLNCDGTWFARRDAIDTRIVNDVINGTGHIIDNPSEVGGWITPASGTPCLDSDHDGMPDVWELAHGLNPNNIADGNQIFSSGYTNLEEFLNGSK